MKRIKRVIFQWNIALAIMISIPTSAHAFKYHTHTWIAQSVINDVVNNDGITIKLNSGSEIVIPVQQKIVNALTEHPEAFILGNIGPDAFPGIVSGQMTAHPGLEDGWKTDDWLKHVYNSSLESEDLRETAFSYGYLGHAAVDMWAHSYVNQYAGDVFWFLDEEIVVEERHLAMELYIDKFVPEIVDPAGNALSLSTLLQLPDREVAEQIRDRLIFNDAVQTQYAKTDSASKHLNYVWQLRNKLKSSEEGVLGVISFILSNLTTADDYHQMDTEWTNRTLSNHQLVESSDNSTYKIRAATLLSDYGILRETMVSDGWDVSLLDSYTSSGSTSEFSTSLNLLNNYNTQQNSTNKLEVEVPDTCYDSFHVPYPCSEWNTLSSALGITIPAANAYTCSSIPSWLDGCRTASGWNTLQSNISLQTTAVNDTQIGFKAESSNFRTNVFPGFFNNYIDAQYASLGLTSAEFNLEEKINSFTALTTIAVLWSTEIDHAMRDWVIMGGQQAVNVMTEPAAGALMAPLELWVDCRLPAILGKPSSLALVECTVNNYLDDLMVGLENELTEPLYADPTGLLIDAKNGIDTLVEKIIVAFAEHVSGYELENFKRMLEEDITEANVQSAFKNPSVKNLLIIPDIAMRLKLEMGVPIIPGEQWPGKLDPENYNVFHNAVVMAKLALLDKEGLNRLARQSGVLDSIVYEGDGLYDPGNPYTPDNILFGALKNMDGDRHWNPISPKHPRQQVASGFNDPYGYYLGAEFKGLRIYEDPVARTNIFREIFKGPVAPGIEAPGEMSTPMPDILPAGYPFRACAADPFPRTISDEDHTTELDGSSNCSNIPQVFANEQGQIIGTFNQTDGLRTYSYDNADVLLRERHHTLPPSRPKWFQDFSVNGDGFWELPAPSMVVQNNTLVVTTLDTPNWDWSGAWGMRLYPMSDAVVFRSEVGTGNTHNGQYVMVGAESDPILGSYRRHAALFDEGRIYASYYDAGWNTALLGTLNNNTNYIIEVETNTSGSTLYVYEKGTFRANGFHDIRMYSDWGYAQTFIEGLSYPGAPNTSMTVDNISESPGLGQVASAYLLTESASDLLIEHEAPSQYLWSNSFDADTSGISELVPSYMEAQTGRIKVTSQNVNWDWPGVWGGRLYPFNDQVVFQSEVTTDVTPSGRYLLVGAESDWSSYRRHAAVFDEGNLYAAYYDGDWMSDWIGSINNSTTYIVELATHAAGTTLYVYEKGQPRDSGVVDHRSFTDWSGVQTYFEAQGYPGAAPGVMYIDNLSESAQLLH